MAALTRPLTASVVIPTFNRRDRVRECVEAALGDPATSEVVVVVDGCDDGSFELLEQMRLEDGRVQPLFVERGGDGSARQAGVEAAFGDVVVMLDDDVIASEGLVTGHLAHHAERDDLLVLGYMPTALERPRRPRMFATELYAREYEATCIRWEEDPLSILTSAWAGNLSIRRDKALMVGLSSPDRPIPYHEDMAFGLRCREAGLVARFDRKLVATHRHARPLAAFVSDARRQGEGALLVHQLHGEGPFPFDDEQPFPAPIKALVRAAARPLLGPWIQAALRGAIRGAGSARLYYAETYLAMVLRLAIQRETITRLESTGGLNASARTAPS